MIYSRRNFVKCAGLGAVALPAGLAAAPSAEAKAVTRVVNPFNRVPVSLIIDDSTCLVNLAHFGIPQFAEIFPDQYHQDWRKLPREIPDSFVREFGEWAASNGVKGKYSIVPYPACTGWVNRFIPGWTKKELNDSLSLVRNLIMPNWDIHPEMISHTRVIDIKTGRPYPFASPDYMENWGWSQDKSADELGAYQAYALSILKEAGLYCEGITTPGGFGSMNQDNLAIGAMEALRAVFSAAIPHYFRDLFTEKEQSVAPRVLHPSGLNGDDPKCVVSIVGCTGDWFGDWDGLHPGGADMFITEDLSSGRLVDVIGSGEPAIMVCHWPGIWFNGEKVGFSILKEVKKRLDSKYDNLVWMKLSEIASYWAAKELSTIVTGKDSIDLKAPFATKGFTIQSDRVIKNPRLAVQGKEPVPLSRVKTQNELKPGTWFSHRTGTLLCFDLEKGESKIVF